MATEIRLDGLLTVASAEEIRDRLVEAVAQGRDVVVECTGAESCDLSFVQLLVAARKSAAAIGVELSLASPATGALLETLRRGGLLESAAERRFWVKEQA